MLNSSLPIEDTPEKNAFVGKREKGNLEHLDWVLVASYLRSVTS
jgi:hypothetical protein